ncbi:MAG: hypothetical protein H8E57_00480, partial [Candidatus Cloacimonetes bacterium]|nr:hypothetical protein [Candidatus Cloacimonadota bacterium]
TVQSGKFNIFTGILIVDGILDVQSGTVLTMTLSGILENNSDFTLNGEFDVNYGYVTINGSFEIASTGSLLIGSGTFISEGGATYNQIYGNLELSSGLYHAKDQIRIKSSATTNISGGTIRSQGFVAQYAGNFQPSGGTVEIQTEDYIYGGLLCNNGNYFHNLEINPTTGNGATLSSDIVIQNDFEITSGQFLINSYEVTVGHDVEIFGYIGMTNSAAILSAGDDINWRSGSSENITAGHIYAEGWAFEDGTNAQLGTGNTVHVDGNITIGDDDAEFGNLEMGSFSRIESRGNRDGVAIRVAGYCTVKTGTSMISNLDFIVEGTMDIEDGATLLMYNSCTLTSDSDFTLNGHLDLTTTGNALVHGEFDFNSSGTLTINGGTFIWDAPYSRTRNILGGNLNLSWGLFEITNNPLILGSTFNSNISGGTIRVGYWFYAYSSSTFQPSGGILEMSDGHAGGNITCYGGNYFHDLVINDSATIDLDSDITVNNDMLINSGTFYLQGFTVDVAEDVEISGELRMTDSVDVLDVGDEIVWQTGSSDNITAGNIYAPFWIFDNGTNAQLGTGNTVHISNTLYCYDADASFGNLECGQFSRIGFDRNRTPQPIRVSGDYSLTAGASWTTNVDIIVNGIVDIENGASLTVNNSSTLETDSAFSLNGDLDLSATGNALVHGNFELESTAELTIAGGDFICDTPYTGYTWLRGTFNISDGLFEVTNNSLNFTSTSIDNISGGTIQVGRTFNASSSGVFQPSGGSVIIAVENASDNIVCINGNYFHDLVIEDNISLNYDLIINNDLIINSGYLNLYNHTLDVGNNVEIYGELQMVSIPDILNIGNDIFWYSGSSELVSNGTINVYGDWIFESGTTARLGYGNTVYFKGNNNSIIRCDDDDAEFGDIIIDTTSQSFTPSL